MFKTHFCFEILNFENCDLFRVSDFEFRISQKAVLFESGEEGGDDVKSAWCLCPGRHTSYNGE